MNPLTPHGKDCVQRARTEPRTISVQSRPSGTIIGGANGSSDNEPAVSENPFSEAGDNDRTIIRPMPGGRRGGRAPAPVRRAPPPAATAASTGEDLAALSATRAGLLAAAAPLLQLLARLGNTASPPNGGAMLDRTKRALREFEQRARNEGVPTELLRPAHYALCVSLDDVVVNTPWGHEAGWPNDMLTAFFHPDIKNGGRFFSALEQICRDPRGFCR